MHRQVENILNAYTTTNSNPLACSSIASNGIFASKRSSFSCVFILMNFRHISIFQNFFIISNSSFPFCHLNQSCFTYQYYVSPTTAVATLINPANLERFSARCAASTSSLEVTNLWLASSSSLIYCLLVWKFGFCEIFVVQLMSSLLLLQRLLLLQQPLRSLAAPCACVAPLCRT